MKKLLLILLLLFPVHGAWGEIINVTCKYTGPWKHEYIWTNDFEINTKKKRVINLNANKTFDLKVFNHQNISFKSIRQKVKSTWIISRISGDVTIMWEDKETQMTDTTTGKCGKSFNEKKF